jgi:hypothetical protein
MNKLSVSSETDIQNSYRCCFGLLRNRPPSFGFLTLRTGHRAESPSVKRNRASTCDDLDVLQGKGLIASGQNLRMPDLLSARAIVE